MTTAGRHVFLVDGPQATAAIPISLPDAGFRERRDLQEWVLAHPEVLGDDVLVVTSEFDRWATQDGSKAKDRLDVLGLAISGRLVVVELKRDEERDIHIQAITYAALVSRFDEDTLASVHADYLSKRAQTDITREAALQRLRDHIEGDFDVEVLSVPRLVLVAGSFPAQVITSADWLTHQGLDIELREVKAWQLGEQVFVTFDQVYPVPGVDDLLLAPARRQATEAVKRADERERSASAVRIVVEGGLLADGAELLLQPAEAAPDVRERLMAWIGEDPRRGRATWINDTAGPLRWSADGDQWSPTALVKHVLKEACGLDRAVVRGPAWWRTPEGDNLVQIAGITRRSGRDWSVVHQLLGAIAHGEWTTYGDLAAVASVAARPLGVHVSKCEECPNAWRVLTSDGTPSAGFTWSDPDDRRTCREALEGEGLSFDEAGRADPAKRVTASELRRRQAHRSSV